MLPGKFEPGDKYHMMGRIWTKKNESNYFSDKEAAWEVVKPEES